jgi:hypothetical protein
VEMFNIDSPEVAHDTPGPSKTKKNEEAQDVSSTSGRLIISHLRKEVMVER